MSTPETPKSTASESLATKPSDTLLKNFKEKLEVRWTEFDVATMKEAQAQVATHPLGGLTTAKKERDGDKRFIQAKSAFDEARMALNSISDDVGLKQILNSPGRLLSAIQTLESHFAVVTAPEKAKEYNHVLANTLADLTSLKSQVTDTAEDKKAAEVAAATVKTMPAIAAGSVGAAALVAGSTLDLEKVADGAQKEIQEATSGFSRWAQEKAKEKGVMGDIFRNLEKKAGEWIKELSEPPKEGWLDAPKENFMYMIKKWLAPMLAGWFGIKTSTPETKAEPGNKDSPTVTPEDNIEKAKSAANTALTITSYKGFTRIFARPILAAGTKEKLFNHSDIDRLITVQGFRDLKYKDILAYNTRYAQSSDKSGLKKDLGISDTEISPDLIAFVISRMATGKGKEYIEKHALVGKDINTIKVSDIFMSLHKNIHIGAKFDDIKPSKPITGPSDFMDYLGEVGTKIDLPLDRPDTIMSNVDYRATIESLGVTASMAGYVVSNKTSNINVINTQTIKESTIGDEKGKEGMHKLIEFWGKFQDTLAEKFGFGNTQKYKEYFKKNGADLGDVFRLYLVTGGNPSPDALNGTQEAYIYMKLWNILGKDQQFRGEYFNQPLIAALFEDGSKVQISPEAKHILNTMFGSVLDTTVDKIGGFIGEVWSTLNTEQKVIFSTVLGGGLVALWYLKPIKWIGLGMTATLTAGALGLAIAAMWPNQQKIKIKDKEYTPEQLKEKLGKDIERI